MNWRCSTERTTNFSFAGWAAFLALALLISFWKPLMGGKTFFYHDFGVLAYPTTFYFKQSILSGEIPLWNPYSNCGAPFLAQWGTMCLYPLSYALVILPLPWGLNVFCIFHLWLAGIGMFRLAERYCDNLWGAAFAGTVFIFNGITLSSLSWPNYTVALAWMPWLIFYSRDGCRGNRRSLGFMIGCGALQMLSGAPEIIGFTWLLAAGLLFADMAGPSVPRGRITLRFVLAFVLTLGISAAQLLPFFELLRHSHRQLGVDSAKWSMPVWGGANFILPLFHAFKTPEGTYFQEGQTFLSSTFIGAGTLVCAFFGLRRKNHLVFLAIMALAAFVLAMGPAGFLFSFAQRVVPGFSFARYPVKFLFLLIFVVPLLAAFFATRCEERSQPKPISGGIIAVLFLTGFLLWWAKNHPFQYDRWGETYANSWMRAGCAIILLGGIGLIAKVRNPFSLFLKLGILTLIAFEGMNHLPNQNPVISENPLLPGIWQAAHKLPKPALGEGRAFITAPAEEKLLMSAVRDPEQDFLGKRLAEWSHLNLLDFVPKVNGSSTLQIQEQSEIQACLYKAALTNIQPWLDFLNVTAISSPTSVVEWVVRPEAKPFISGGQKPVFVSANTLLAVVTNEFEVGKAYLEETESDLKNAAEGQVRISEIKTSTRQIEFTTESATPSIVTIAQSYYPEWKAEIGGKPTKLSRCNYAFQGLLVPAGKARVRLIYRDTAFNLGLCVSLASLAALVAWLYAPGNHTRENQ